MATTMNTGAPLQRVRLAELPAATTSEAGKAYARLQTPASDPSWLPLGIASEVDELRDRHHRRLRQLHSAAVEWRRAHDRLRDADAAHAKATAEAMRTGAPLRADERPSANECEAELRPLVGNVHAAAVELARFAADDVIATIREHEDEWIASLVARLPEAEAKRQQAALLLAEARADEWRLDRAAAWLKGTADDVGFAPPSPDAAGDPPPVWQPDAGALRRPWHQKREWNDKTPEEAAALEGPRPHASPAKQEAAANARAKALAEANARPVPASLVPLSEDEKYDRGPGGAAA